ncbi:MAG: UDP-N-acetylglucosamine--N-acetylmuramyl-(pentapeptide) pyrophosphoryl-undecaprenol N-acetylglucosamine transferase [Anaerolineae bacterium]|nr:UDP-N-acetylglucosamine--N-acetylmuramyl-(pentapeptide) pyrophosphoryl-undecaprenol N-acetylglucosamine transferase [Anaerolineae bacterium]
MIGAGGTGGHVYPALAVAEVLRKSANYKHHLVFVGTRGGGGIERPLVTGANLDFDAYHEVFAGPIVGVNPFQLMSSLVKMGLGCLQSFSLLLRERPQAILLTGGWANVPLALAAWIRRIPMLVYLPDIEPGRTIQLLSKLNAKIAITVPESSEYFRDGQSVVTGYPLRSEVTSANRLAAKQQFNLDPHRKTILVTGGSRGARTINIAIENNLAALLELPVQVIHVTGKLDWERSQAQVQNAAYDTTHYHPFPYLESAEMGLAFAAADIIVGRSGASSIGEFPYFGAASILVPYPYAWRYQKINADWLVTHGVGIRINNEDMASDLLPTLAQLITDTVQLEQMQDCAKALFKGNGADNLAQELLLLAGADSNG